ncbi:MAG TPA: hypothetical protein VL986_05395 [Terracidiphilus sp.]|nr:hypothetical protein [Terracidiphilus sp.]
MGSAAQTRAVKSYRKRLSKRGMVRFEVLGLRKDRELVRAVARKLAEDGPGAEEIRVTMEQRVAAGPSTKGGIWNWLRNSPLVGAELDLTRPFEEGRKIDL